MRGNGSGDMNIYENGTWKLADAIIALNFIFRKIWRVHDDRNIRSSMNPSFVVVVSDLLLWLDMLLLMSWTLWIHTVSVHLHLLEPENFPLWAKFYWQRFVRGKIAIILIPCLIEEKSYMVPGMEDHHHHVTECLLEHTCRAKLCSPP